MAFEVKKCLIVENNSEHSEFIQEMLRQQDNLLVNTKLLPESNAVAEDFSIPKADVYIYIYNADNCSFETLINFIEKQQVPVLVLLECNNYELAYNLKLAGAFETIFVKDISVQRVTKLLKKALSESVGSQQEEEKSEPLFNLNVLKSMFDYSRLGYAIFDMAGTMLDCNKSLEDILGFKRQNLLALTLLDICSPDSITNSDHKSYRQECEELLQEKRSHFEFEKPLYAENGTLIWSRIFLSSMIKVKDFPKVVVLTLNNISERKRIQTDLEYERYFLQTLMDNIPDAIYFKDANHRFLKVSKYVHLKGMSDPAQAIGKTDFDFFTGEHANEAYEDEEEIIRTGKPLINKLEKETFPNGEIAWVSTTKAPLFSKEGTVSGIVGISRDLTEIKLKEEALQKSEERYRNLIEYAPDTIAVLCENEIIFTNAAGITLMSAKNKEEILNHRIEEFLHPQYFALTKYFLEQILKSQKPAKAPRIKLIRCDGALFDAEITGIPTTYFDKKAIQLVIRDITETKKQEKIKQTTLKILQASNYSKTIDELFKLIHHAVSNLMPAKNFYISLFDEKTELLSFPYFIDEEDEIMEAKPLGKGLTEYILRNGKAELITEQQDLDLREKGEVELRGAPAKIWLGVPLQIKEKTIGVMVVQDYHNENAYGENEKEILEMISFSVSRAIERRKAEEEILKYIDKLKDTNATKDRFFSFISHDLRGPFSSLLGFSEMILEDFDSFSKEDIRKYVSTIKATSQNLYNLLNNLLQFTRFQTGRILFNPMRTSIKEVVAKNIEMLKGNCIKKDIELITEVKNDDIVLIDEEMISSTIQNLITNAIKFTPRKGWIKITSQRRENEGMIEISVQDSGIGMNSTVMDNLFRVDVIQTTIGTEKESGTGLGLILAKESVEKHKGKIWAESHKGKGSTFRFTLPLAN